VNSDIFAQVNAAISADRVIELATLMCSIPSPLGCEGELAEFVNGVLGRSGVDVQLDEVVTGRPNVIARVPGGGTRPPLVLNGHLDAAVYPEAWSHDQHQPWIDGDRLYGGGITDMVGAVACMVAATEAAAGIKDMPGDLIFQAVMHHDGTGLGTKYALAVEPLSVGYAICGEPSNLSVHTANGGAFKFEITIGGVTQHISRLEDGIDALPAAVEVYRVLRSHVFDFTPHPRLPSLPRTLVGQFEAGSSPAHVAEVAVLRGDLRSVPGMTRESVLADLRRAVDAAGVDSRFAKVRILSRHQPFLGAEDGPLIDVIGRAHEIIRGSSVRMTSELPGQAFVTDAADLAHAGLETVVYGPGEWRHRPNESIKITDLVDAARIYLAVALGLGATETDERSIMESELAELANEP
jgi:acetylornithine deacetylase/succinyl-diaminopimelate desuccinylase-like protein